MQYSQNDRVKPEVQHSQGCSTARGDGVQPGVKEYTRGAVQPGVMEYTRGAVQPGVME